MVMYNEFTRFITDNLNVNETNEIIITLLHCNTVEYAKASSTKHF